MNLLHRLTRILVVAALLAAGLFVLAMALTDEGWRYLAWLVRHRRMDAAWSGFGVVCLGVLHMLSGFSRRPKERFLSFDNDSGTVSISTRAIAEYIEKLVSEFPSIVRMTCRVEPRRDLVDLFLDVRVRSGPQIHEMCALLQQRVRESMSNGLGVSQVGRVEVSVKEIVSEHRPR